MCQVCTEAFHSAALWTRTLSQVWTCVKYVPKQSIPQHFEHERYHRFGHVSSMYRSSPFRIALGTRTLSQVWTCVKYVPKQSIAYHFKHERYHRFGHVSSMYRSSPFRSILNTNVITGLDMCQVCTEAFHSAALWTRTLSQVWTCVKYVPKQSIPQHFEHERYHRFGHVSSMYRSSPFRSILNTNVMTGLDMCQVCTEAFHSAALRTRTLSQVWTRVK